MDMFSLTSAGWLAAYTLLEAHCLKGDVQRLKIFIMESLLRSVSDSI